MYFCCVRDGIQRSIYPVLPGRVEIDVGCLLSDKTRSITLRLGLVIEVGNLLTWEDDGPVNLRYSTNLMIIPLRCNPVGKPGS